MPRRRDAELKHESLKVQFIATELDLAITFCEIALSTKNEAAAHRNVTNAKRAHQTASRALEETNLTWDVRQEIADRWTRLGDLLGKLDGR